MGFDWGSDFGNDFDWGKGWWGGVLKKNVNKLMYWKFNVNKPYDRFQHSKNMFT